MKNARRKRILLGWLALAAPLPLPLNDVLEWPVLFVYAVLVVRMMQRAQNGATRWLENRHLNILGLIYLPVLGFDLRYGAMTGRILSPLLHLVLFVTLAKLWSLRRERDTWHTFVAIFVIFLASMATSTHLTVVLYLLAGAAAGLGALNEMARLHVLETVERTVSGRAEPTVAGGSLLARRRLRWNGALTLLICLVAIPLFAAIPRLREPLVMGRGQGLTGGGSATGFSDSVDLSLTSAVRDNPSVALRIESDRPLSSVGNLRLKGGGFAYYRDGHWLRESGEAPLRSLTGRFELTESATEPPIANRMTIYQEPMATRSVLLPLEALSIETQRPLLRSLWLDPGGVVRFPGLPRRQVSVFEIEVAEQPSLKTSWDNPHLVAALDRTGITPRIAELAADVVGSSEGAETEAVDPLERIRRVESHLLSSYTYTLDFVGRDGLRPVEDFLFDYQSGHCELFATAMVLMLRAEGVPARFVTGFLGAEANRLEGFYVVRQSNAHAWVEAWTEDTGWRTYDPTPPEGRPGAREQSLRLLAQQVWDFLAFRWDRYVLTFGADDQRGLFDDLRARVQELWERLTGDDEETAETSAGREPPESIEIDPDEQVESTAPWQRPAVRYGGLALLALFALIAWRLLHRRAPSPDEAYATLRARLSEAGFLDVDESTPPLALRRRSREALPEAASAIDRVVDLYVATAFAQRPADDGARADLADDLRTVDRAIEETLRARRRAERVRRRAA